MSHDNLSPHPHSDYVQQQIIQLISDNTPEPGVFQTAIDGLSLHRWDSAIDCDPSVYSPALAFVAQGTKVIRLGDQEMICEPLDYGACTVHLPVSGCYTEASAEQPFLGLKIDLDNEDLTRLVLETSDEPSNRNHQVKSPELICGLCKSQMDFDMQVAILRFLTLLNTPKDIPILAPLVRREIFYRALNSELGTRIRSFASTDSQAHRISRVITTLQLDFSKPLRIAELAAEANMSESSLYHTFKKVTRMSPLQFQKKLRLQEARRLMLADGLDAASASFKVGYESPSQFSREYSRMYGTSPKADVSKLRGSTERADIY